MYVLQAAIQSPIHDARYNSKVGSISKQRLKRYSVLTALGFNYLGIQDGKRGDPVENQQEGGEEAHVPADAAPQMVVNWSHSWCMYHKNPRSSGKTLM